MWMIGTKWTILEGTLLWCGGKLKELPWSIQAQRTHIPPYQSSQQKPNSSDRLGSYTEEWTSFQCIYDNNVTWRE